MIHYLDGRAGLDRQPDLADGMFRDRAAQFVDRLAWDVGVDAEGREIDQYDALDPVYVVASDAAGRHAGSMRFLPATGRTMIAEHFPQLAPGGWAMPGAVECTRLCIAPGAAGHVAAELLLGALGLGLRRGWRRSFGVFDARMERVYARLGWPVRVVSRSGPGRDALCLGSWEFLQAPRAALEARARVTLDRVA
ncbi:acyl-homoserine-lactone synthase [Palleronia sediminis]|nr:acyl-homoserine-lactone synthase [Palleronia sediminis]